MAKKSGLKQDKYRKARGGHARLLVLACEKCGATLCKSQKDGPGILKRLYIDRISENTTSLKKIVRRIDCLQDQLRSRSRKYKITPAYGGDFA